MKTRTKVQTFEVNIYCEDCSKKPNPGCRLIYKEVDLRNHPLIYTHECQLCKKNYNLDNIYPSIEYITE